MEDIGAKKFAHQITMDEWKQEFGVKKFDEQKRQFDVGQHLKEKDLELKTRRTAAYEESVKRTGNKQDADKAADAAESDVLTQQASEYDGMIATLDPDMDSTEIEKLKTAATASRKRAAVLAARVNAKGGSATAPQGPNKGVTKDALKKMTEAEFRAYYKNSPSTSGKQLTDAEVNAAVKRWKKMSGKPNIAGVAISP
jgi:hypothetical protein